MTVKCNHCGRFLPGTHTGPCPNCGKTGKTITVQDVIQLSDTAGYTSIREYYEKNTIVLAIVVGITVFSAFLGLFLGGVPGVFVGLLLGGMSFVLGPRAETKVRESHTGTDGWPNNTSG